MRKEPITIRITRNAMIKLTTLAKEKDCSKSSLCSRAIDLYLNTTESSIPTEILARLYNLTSLSPPRIIKCYNEARTTKVFWSLILPYRSKAKVVADIEGNIYAKYKKKKNIIPLPQTGNLLKDIEEGVKNIEDDMNIVPVTLCEKKESKEEYEKHFFDKLNELDKQSK